MSRSLDKVVLTSLKAEDPRPAYQDISSLLSGHLTTVTTNHELLEIEFLGTSHPLEPGINYLRDGSAIAIPRLRLVQAFMVARQILHEYLDTNRTNPDIVPEDVLIATPVLLLMDPEHLTAANTRKRALQQKLAATASTAETRRQALHAEKYLVDSFLTSRLHRHTKSPTLWSHRRWLLEACQSNDLDLVFDLKSEITKVVMVSGERHPKNYYAWQHARWLVIQNLQSVDTSPSNDDDGDDARTKLVEEVKNWCLKHPGDVSGWSFLAFVLEHVSGSNAQQTSIDDTVVSDVVKITESFRWTNESVWVFLREILVTGRMSENNIRNIKAVQAKFSKEQSSISWLKNREGC